jgi:hypothetical protein
MQAPRQALAVQQGAIRCARVLMLALCCCARVCVCWGVFHARVELLLKECCCSQWRSRVTRWGWRPLRQAPCAETAVCVVLTFVRACWPCGVQ